VVVAILGRPLGGYLADRIAATSILTAVFLAVAVLQIVLAFQPGLSVLTPAFLIIALLLGLGSGAVFKLVGEHFPRNAGVVAGLVGIVGGIGGFFPPLVMGIVKDATGTYALGFMLLSEFALICLVVNVLVLQRLVFGQRRGASRIGLASQSAGAPSSSANGHTKELTGARRLEKNQDSSAKR
jgi:MFS transporter, NNP family, nitrate/nitrite transporter